jgi:hypothetical protein
MRRGSTGGSTEVNDTAEPMRSERDDEKLVRLTSARVAEAVHQPADIVEAAVRDAFARWRSTARIQTFVPIFAERTARDRLAG